MAPDKKPQVRTYQGAEAVSMFFKEKKADIDAMQVARFVDLSIAGIPRSGRWCSNTMAR